MTRGGDENRDPWAGLGGSENADSQGNSCLSAIGNGSPSTPVERSSHPRNSPLSCGGHPGRPKATSSLTSATTPIHRPSELRPLHTVPSIGNPSSSGPLTGHMGESEGLFLSLHRPRRPSESAFQPHTIHILGKILYRLDDYLTIFHSRDFWGLAGRCTVAVHLRYQIALLPPKLLRPA